jgi:hypothetical protein
MERRNFLKHVLATAAVGAVAPRVLAEPVSFTTRWIAPESLAVTLDDWTWTPLGATSEIFPGKIIVLKARSLGISYNPLYVAHRKIFLDTTK